MVKPKSTPGATPKTARSSFDSSTPTGTSVLKECKECHCLLSAKDTALHTKSFCDLVRDDLEKAVEIGEHGFIISSTLHALVADVEVKEDELPTHISSFRLENCLAMNQSAMDHLEISPGDAVHLSLTGFTTILLAFPVTSVKGPCKVVLPDAIHNYFRDVHSLCSVKKISVDSNASKIIVSCPSTNYNPIDATISLRARLNNVPIFEGMQVLVDVSGSQLKFIVTQVNPSNDSNDLSGQIDRLSINASGKLCKFYKMIESSRIFTEENSSLPKVTFKDVAGLEKEIKLLEKYILLPLKQLSSEKITKSYPLPHGILVHGFTGTGKTHTVNAFINEHCHSLYCVKVDSASLIARSAESCEKKIRSLFTLAVDQVPSVIFIDRVEIICSTKKTPTENEKQICYFLLTQLELLDSRKRSSFNLPSVTVVGLTNQPDSIDTCFKGPGKFEFEIEFPIPIAESRKKIMSTLLSRGPHNIESKIYTEIAGDAFGFTGADLESVISRAYSDALEDGRSEINADDLKRNINSSKPSAMREIILEVPAVRWSEIGGVECIKKKLEQMIVWPFKYPNFLKSLGIEPKKGILMYGPPGCSKTMIGKAIATEYKLNFLSIKGPELFNKFVGESEKSVRDLFKRARQAAPSIIFFDEIDALAPERGNSGSSSSNVSDRVLAQLLTELDGIESRSEVIVVAATNRPDIIDPALRRPGRLDSQIYVPLPNETARREIILIRTRKMPLDKSVDIDKLVDEMKGYSGAEITAVCTEAGFAAAASSIDNLNDGEEPNVSSVKVTWLHFESALKSIKPKTSEKMVHFFNSYSQNCGDI